jgi:predicted RNA-binding protein YlxR (DUF448 family)
LSRKDKFKRQCVICREFKDKSELIRFTKDFQTQNIEINDENEFTGRSAYICKEGECLAIAIKKQVVEKKLKAKGYCSVYQGINWQ